MSHEAIDGLVIRVRNMGANDRYLTVLTAEKGRITLLAKGSKSLRGEQRAVSQLFTYANFEYYKKGDFYILKGGSVIDSFYAISMDMDRMNLAAYLCEATYELTDEGAEAGDMLRLLLNALYAVSHNLYPQETVKGAFELRAAAMSGYAPEADGCCICGTDEAALFYLDVMNGALFCSDCLKKRGKELPPATGTYDDIREAQVICPLTASARTAVYYALTAPAARAFLFALKDAEDSRLFSACAETYLLSHLGRGFESLNFYHMMRNSAKGTKT